MDSKFFQQQLLTLRTEIDEVDQELVELLAKRRKITTKVGKLKSEVGMPIYVPEREEKLINLRRKQAEKAGLSPDLIEDVLRRLMRDSYVSQDINNYLCVNPRCQKIVVIGGKGQLGRVFVDLFKRSGYQVCSLEQDDWPNSEAILAQASVVLVAVPIGLTVTVIEKLNNLPAECILADVTSIKASPLVAMKKIHAGPVVGLHPMFGPDVTSLVKQTVIVCQGRMPEKYHWLLEQFQVWGVTIHAIEATEHDKAMSVVQVLRHFSTIAYGYHLMTEHVDIGQLVDMSSPIYRLELIMVGRLFAQNPVLYTDIIFSNKDNIAMMKRFATVFLDLLAVVEGQNKALFIDKFAQVSDWFGEYADNFLQESKGMLLKANELKKT